MTALHYEPTPAGLIASLANALEPNSPLAREARKLARRLAKGTRSRALQRQAADLTLLLLNATDAGLPMEGDGLLDGGFDD